MMYKSIYIVFMFDLALLKSQYEMGFGFFKLTLDLHDWLLHFFGQCFFFGKRHYYLLMQV